ncbi:DEAD/DEAH box helicase [Ordospora pajunii]|uniref:DEAD/DEAH box helicase n=1 Tax=Ordospora pajunii TaxID=3039483 RepID=UPI00295270EA|nr:DEAD/DEAH box helicase [Ordospora pajunii]KAH9411137.1 DEAD/DEAH box helicase [Ordospora pajunii]
MDELVKKVSSRLGTSAEETSGMIAQALSSSMHQEQLLELLGYEMIDEVIAICANKQYFMPQESVSETQHYVEYVFPEPVATDVCSSELVEVDAVGDDGKYFEYRMFNAVQSKVFRAAYQTDGNLLVCAPTSSGKTDIALMAVLRALAKGHKVAYVVPMRALATEVACKYRRMFGGSKVLEYTGDTDADTKDVLKSDVIVCTPEKLDVATRKLHNVFCETIGLLVIDEVHILQDDRGPVVEAVVCRIMRYIESVQRHIRIVGLSATLPNYMDVAIFLKAEHVFAFGQEYRPVPLRMSIVGMKKGSKESEEQEFLKKKVQGYLNEGKQVLVFVNARGETVKTAKLLMDLCAGACAKGHALSGIMLSLIKGGVGIHHAGLPRRIRLYMEEAFRRKEIGVLVTTSTLAWGVNLPAYAVIVKGTRFYDGVMGRFADLGILDILQIFGRAGRPQFGSKGEACLITTARMLDHYVSLMKNNTNIESRLLRHAADTINAEIHLGAICSISAGVEWLKNTFMYVRMFKNPMLYDLSMDDLANEDDVLARYMVLACNRLEGAGLIRICKQSDDYMEWRLCGSEYGRIASVYYLCHETMERWQEAIADVSGADSILGVCFMAKEFCTLRCREDDEECIQELCEEMGLRYEMCVECKLNVLVRAYMKGRGISRFSLVCDTEYVIKNLKRVLTAFGHVLVLEKMHAMAMECCMLQKRIERQKQMPWNGSNVIVDLTKVKEMLRMKIGVEMKAWCWVFVWNEEKVIHSEMFEQRTESYIRSNAKNVKIQVICRDEWKGYEKECVVKVDSSAKALYETGVHECETPWSIVQRKQCCQHFDAVESLAELEEYVCRWMHGSLSRASNGNGNQQDVQKSGTESCVVFTDKKIVMRNREECMVEGCSMCYNGKLSYAPGVALSYLRPDVPHGMNMCIFFDFEINIKLIQMDCEVFRERLKLISASIFSMVDLGAEQVVIIAPDENDARHTMQDLNTRMILSDMQFEGDGRVKRGVPRSRQRGVYVATFDEAATIRGHPVVVLKGCSGIHGYFPVYEVLRICNRRKVYVYERRNYIEYLNSCVLVDG